MWRFLLLVGWLVSLDSTVSGCRCMQEPMEKKYCRADFAILGDIKSRTLTNVSKDGSESPWKTVIYKVDVVKVFRNSSRAGQIGQKVEVRTSAEGASCGVNLAIGEGDNKYVLTGYVVKDSSELYIHSCGWNRRWADMDTAMKTKLEEGAVNCRAKPTKPPTSPLPSASDGFTTHFFFFR